LIHHPDEPALLELFHVFLSLVIPDNGQIRFLGLISPQFRYTVISIFVEGEEKMSDHIYKIMELTGSSATGMQDAIENAITRAAKTVQDMRWFEVVETRGHIEQGKIGHWQVTIKVGFTLRD
jgi:hypothetical protein